MLVKQSDSSLREFLATHPVFTVPQLARWYASGRAVGERTVEALLAYHTKSGHLLRIRKGLYAVVPPGLTPATVSVDPFLIAGHLISDAVLAFHTALELHGKAHSLTHQFLYLTNLAARPFVFRGQRFIAVRQPATLRRKQAEHFGVVSVDRMGLRLRVTSLERTMVDLLNRPRFGGGWEEIWRSLEGIEFFDLDAVVEHALLLDNATTIAKVGFFLEQHRESLMVEERHLLPLRRRIPRVPHYLSHADRGAGKLVPGWNLVVPAAILERRWHEMV